MTELATAEAVAEGQVEGQEVQPEVQPDDEMYVRVPKSNFGHLTGDADFNKVVHMANQWQEAQDSGLTALGQRIADSGLNPYGVLADWNGPVEEAPVQQPPVQQDQQQAQDQQQGQYMTPEQIDALVDKRFDAKIGGVFDDRDRKAQTQSALDAQRGYISSAIDSLGHKSNPTKFALAGTDHELSPVRDLLIEPAILTVAQRIHAQGLNPNAPDYQEKLWGPMSEQTIIEATNHVQQVLAIHGQAQLEHESDNQAILPVTSLGTGAPGSSVKKDAKDMTAAEKKKDFLDWEAGKRAARER